MLKKPNLTTLNDGVCDIYRDPNNRTPFGARVNPTIEELKSDYRIAHMWFKSLSIRESDIQIAERKGFTLAAKIRCYFLPFVDTDCRVLIGNKSYGIKSIDHDHQTMFLYLEGGECVE